MKTVGYAISSISVVLLGLVAWRADQPTWKAVALVAGMSASIVGMFFRFLSHHKEAAAIAYAQRESEHHQ